MDILGITNNLLSRLGVADHPFTSVEELLDNSSSTLVAFYESLFVTRLPGIHRRPKTEEHYAENAQIVIDSLRSVLPGTVVIPEGLSGEGLSTDLPAVTFLFSLMNDLEMALSAHSNAQDLIEETEEALGEENASPRNLPSPLHAAPREPLERITAPGTRARQGTAQEIFFEQQRGASPSIRASQPTSPAPLSPPLLSSPRASPVAVGQQHPSTTAAPRVIDARTGPGPRVVDVPVRPIAVTRALEGSGGKPFYRSSPPPSSPGLTSPGGHADVAMVPEAVAATLGAPPVFVDAEGRGRPATAPHSQARKSAEKQKRSPSAEDRQGSPQYKPSSSIKATVVSATHTKPTSFGRASAKLAGPPLPSPPVSSHQSQSSSSSARSQSSTGRKAGRVPSAKASIARPQPVRAAVAPRVKPPPLPSPVLPTPHLASAHDNHTLEGSTGSLVTPPTVPQYQVRLVRSSVPASASRGLSRSGGKRPSTAATGSRPSSSAAGKRAGGGQRTHSKSQVRGNSVGGGAQAGAVQVNIPAPSAADLLHAEERRRVANAAAVLRQHRMIMQRVHAAEETELRHLSALHDITVKARLSDFKRLEASALRSAVFRTKAAKHERKVLAVRTQRVCEEMARHTLSLRLKRSSAQSVAASSLLKAYAAQVKAAAADELKAAAEERAAQLVGAQASLAAAAHSMAIAAEVVREETGKQISQRAAAMRSQKEALARALRDMATDRTALLQAVKDAQTHAEEVFFAHHVEPLNPDEVRGGDGRAGVDASALLHAGLRNRVDTDSDPGRVDTMARVDGVLSRFGAELAAKSGAAVSILKQGATDAAEAIELAHELGADAEGMENLAKQLPRAVM